MVESLLKWLPLASLVVQFLFAWALWSADKRYARSEKHAELDSRVQKLELKLENLPDGKRMGQLTQDLERLRGELKRAEATVEGFERTVQGVQHQINLLLENELRG